MGNEYSRMSVYRRPRSGGPYRLRSAHPFPHIDTYKVLDWISCSSNIVNDQKEGVDVEHYVGSTKEPQLRSVEIFLITPGVRPLLVKLTVATYTVRTYQAASLGMRVDKAFRVSQS